MSNISKVEAKTKNPYPGIYEVKGKENRYLLEISVTVNGETIRKQPTITAKSKEHARKIRDRMKFELEELYKNGFQESKYIKMTFRDLIIDWRGSSPKLAYTTKATYESGIKNYISKFFGTMLLRDCKTSTIYSFIYDLRANYKLSDKTIYNQTMILRTLLTYAEDRDYIKVNPFNKFKMEKIEYLEPEILYFSDVQMVRIIQQLDVMVNDLEDSFTTSIKYQRMDPVERQRRQNLRRLSAYAKRLFVHLSIVTGARRGEVVGIKWNNIDFEQEQITFKGSTFFETGVGASFKKCLKENRTSKSVYMNQGVFPILSEYRRLLTTVLRENNWKDTGKVFITVRAGRNNEAGVPATGDNYSNWFGDWCRRNKDVLGLTDEEAEQAHLHMLRHSSISFELNNGTDLKTVAKMVGHSNAIMTDRRYGHVYDKSLKAASRRFDVLYEEAQKSSEEDPAL